MSAKYAEDIAMQSLGAMMNGVVASTTTLTFTEQGIGMVRQANTATNLVGSEPLLLGLLGMESDLLINGHTVEI